MAHSSKSKIDFYWVRWGVWSFYPAGLSAIFLGVFTGCTSVQTLPSPTAASALAHRLEAPGDPDKLKDTYPVKQVVEQEMTGLEFEEQNLRRELLRQADTYARFKLGRLTLQDKVLRKAECESGKTMAAFCDDGVSDRKGARPIRARRRTTASTVVFKSILRGDLHPLRQATEADLLAGMKRITKVEALSRIAQQIDREMETLPAVDPSATVPAGSTTDPAAAAVSQLSCVNSLLQSVVAMKLEQFFPEKTAQERAERYYLNAVRCRSDLIGARAAYRLSLIFISEGRYAEAEPKLEFITRQADARDYYSRAYYWLSQAAGQRGDVVRKKEWITRLLGEFPFSLHALLLGESDLLTLLSKDGDQEPRVRFRSKSQPQLNETVRIVEAMEATGSGSATIPALEDLIASLKSAEPEFQLYVAVLLRRAGDNVKKFQLLSVLLRENPTLFSLSTMRLLYPLHQFELIRNHEAEADPWLVLSLVRQESAFNTHARSPAGAVGLMQLMPATARRMEHITKRQLFEPSVNLRLGVRYFSRLLNRYDGSAELALAAYNAGPDRVDEWIRRYPTTSPLLFVDLIPFKETREYVASIARNYFWYQKLYEQHEGFESLPKARSGSAFALFRKTD